MEEWQQYLIIAYSCGALLFMAKGLYESIAKKNVYGQQTLWMNIYGAFVWGDAAVLCTFWFFAGVITLYLHNWILFLLIQSVFWLVRSLGETLYWFLVQFSMKDTDPSERFWLSKYFPGTSVWFINQMFWQCVSIITLIATFYFAHQWLLSI